MLFYTCAIILGAVASRNANTNLVAAISNIISAIIPVSVIIPILNKKLFTNSKYGVVMSVLTGIAIALFTMALTKSYSTNKVAIVAPVVFGGAIFLSSLLSYFFFKEKISFIQGVGLALLGLGLIFIIYARSTGR